MKCPNCGTVCKSSQQIWQEKMQAQGRCIGCAEPLDPKVDQRKSGAFFLRCRRCRITVTARGTKKYRAAHPNDLSA